ncbi:MAG: 30S ribosomal protein S7 [Candidatus Diapherotrites archaeon]|nr:30S ribosomal protein S7 [Candidatus Diapherotrites archaeon]
MLMAKIFDRWETSDIKVNDLGLQKYICLETKTIPHSFGRNSKKRFDKAKVNIVERLANKLMRSGQGKRKLSGKYIRGRGSTGKKLQALHIVEDAFDRIERRTKKNPVEVLIRALEYSAPREDTTRLKKGGISYSQSVDVAPMRRLDEALKNLALAAFANSFNNKTSAEDALAEELILASQENSKSQGVKRRNEVERIAVSSR